MTKSALGYERPVPEMLYWEEEKGVEFLRRIGINEGDNVLDFGCRVGHYTIPAAIIAGSEGVVYAIDTQENALTELERKKKALNLTNIKILKTSGQLSLPLEDEIIDAVLLYDVLHYIKKLDRKKLYREIFRVLKQDGLLSIYPKHSLEDNPMMEFRSIGLENIKQEIQSANFFFDKRHCGLISHDNGLNRGCMLNFRKGKKISIVYDNKSDNELKSGGAFHFLGREEI